MFIPFKIAMYRIVKKTFFFIIITTFATLAKAQPLNANAGADKTICLGVSVGGQIGEAPRFVQAGIITGAFSASGILFSSGA